MSKRYIFLILVLVSAIFALLLLPKLYYCSNDKDAKLHYKATTCANAGPKGLLLEAINTHRYIDADKLASKIIGEDPSYAYVDLRNEEQFNSFTFPGAINIPYSSIWMSQIYRNLIPMIIPMFCFPMVQWSQTKLG